MINDQDLPILLWVEATSTTIYVHNKIPRRILGEKNPKDVFINVKPKVGHLRIFGCPVYIHVPKEKRTDMEPSKKKGTFVGYSATSKAYCIYVPGQR
jgi:hypothetical protein